MRAPASSSRVTRSQTRAAAAAAPSPAVLAWNARLFRDLFPGDMVRRVAETLGPFEARRLARVNHATQHALVRPPAWDSAAHEFKGEVVLAMLEDGKFIPYQNGPPAVQRALSFWALDRLRNRLANPEGRYREPLAANPDVVALMDQADLWREAFPAWLERAVGRLHAYIGEHPIEERDLVDMWKCEQLLRDSHFQTRLSWVFGDNPIPSMFRGPVWGTNAWEPLDDSLVLFELILDNMKQWSYGKKTLKPLMFHWSLEELLRDPRIGEEARILVHHVEDSRMRVLPVLFGEGGRPTSLVMLQTKVLVEEMSLPSFDDAENGEPFVYYGPHTVRLANGRTVRVQLRHTRVRCLRDSRRAMFTSHENLGLPNPWVVFNPTPPEWSPLEPARIWGGDPEDEPLSPLSEPEPSYTPRSPMEEDDDEEEEEDEERKESDTRKHPRDGRGDDDAGDASKAPRYN